MTSIDDPQGLKERLGNELDRLDAAVEKGSVSKAERQKIKGFLNYLKANKDNKSQTNADRVASLRLTSERSQRSLIEMEKPTLDAFTIDLREDYDLSKGTVNNYKKAWKPFFRFLGRDWAEEIEFYNIDDVDKVDRSKVFSDEEIDAMLSEANSRMTTLIALLADTGARIGMILSLRVGDADFTGDVAVVTLNEEAPIKGADGNLPLIWSRSYVSNYLQNDHPRPDQEDVALIHKKPGEYEEDGDGAVHYKTGREKVQEVMEEVGIEKDRRKLHNFRHTAVTNWIRMGIRDRVLQYRTKWSDMSQRERYEHLLDEDLDLMAAEDFGLSTPDESEDNSSPEDALGECPICFTTVRSGARYCPGCGNPITPNAAHDTPPNGVQDPETTAEDLATIDSVIDEMGTGAILEKLIRENPELLDDINFD